jgi:hypothetical protein
VYQCNVLACHHLVVSLKWICITDSALGESAALWALLAALQRPQPQVQVCDASCRRLWTLRLLQWMVTNKYRTTYN